MLNLMVRMEHGQTLPGWVTAVIFFVLYVIITLIATIGDSRKEIKEGDNYFTLFKNNLAHSYRFTLLFLLLAPVVMIAIYYSIYKHIPLYIPLTMGYFTWCVYVHLHYLVFIPIKSIKLPAGDPYNKYVALAAAYRHLKGFVFVFPLPFLLVFRWWHLWRLKKLRDTPYTCVCGAPMTKLNEIHDDKFLSAVEILEEQLKSIDYDVWICANCDRHMVLKYEDYHSAASHCSACSRKTLELTEREVIRPATKHAGGFGYNHFKCRNCASEHKVEFSIPKKSSSDTGGSASGSGGSWGGGRSGGGGAGSSW
jgi:uncharacterized protein